MQQQLILLLYSFLNIQSITPSVLETNNVCQSVEDYKSIQNNKNCWYDYVTDLEVPELVMKAGRPFEVHKAVTPDGFILTMFRIARSGSGNKMRNPVFLQHGFVSSAKYWVALGNDSLAFQLHDHGFDVWMGNYRGSKYSDEHISLSVKDEEFWEHNIDDLASKDLPTMLDKVVELTGKNDIIYIAHSLGASMGLMFATESPAAAKARMKAMVLIAPAYHLSNAISPVKLVVNYADILWDIAKTNRLLYVTSYGPILNKLIRLICLSSSEAMAICIHIAGYIYGTRTGIQPNQFPNFIKLQFTGTALKIAYHLTTFMKGKFSKFDYGINNTVFYGQDYPPIYDVSKVEIPTVIAYAKNDWITTKLDALQLIQDMNQKYIYSSIEIGEDNFNHVDFIFGSRSRELFIDRIIAQIKKLDAGLPADVM